MSRESKLAESVVITTIRAAQSRQLPLDRHFNSCFAGASGTSSASGSRIKTGTIRLSLSSPCGTSLLYISGWTEAGLTRIAFTGAMTA